MSTIIDMDMGMVTTALVYETPERPRQERTGLERPRQERLSLERPRQEHLDLERPRQQRLSLERVRQERSILERSRQESLSLDRMRQQRPNMERPKQERPKQERPMQGRQRQMPEELNRQPPYNTNDSIHRALMAPIVRRSGDELYERGVQLASARRAPLAIIGEANILEIDNDDNNGKPEQDLQSSYAKWTISFAFALCAMVYLTQPSVLTLLTNMGSSFKKH